jgi:hypothetical protein
MVVTRCSAARPHHEIETTRKRSSLSPKSFPQEPFPTVANRRISDLVWNRDTHSQFAMICGGQMKDEAFIDDHASLAKDAAKLRTASQTEAAGKRFF